MILPTRKVARALALSLAASAALIAAGVVRAADVVIDGATKYQTVEGWGTTISSGESFYNPANFSGTGNAGYVYAKDLGLNIFRIYFEPNTLMGVNGVSNLTTVVNFTGDLATDVPKINYDQPRTQYQDNFAAWLKTNVLEPEHYKIIISCWSPPHWMKENADPANANPQIVNFGNDTQGGTLRVDQAQQFARYSAAFVKGFADKAGHPVYGYSLSNETTYENPFNSCTYLLPNSNFTRYAVALKAIRDDFARHTALQGVKLMGPHVAGVGQTPDNPYTLWWQSSFINDIKANSDSTLINAVSIYTHHDYVMGLAKGAVMNKAYWDGGHTVPNEPWASWFNLSVNAPGYGKDGKGNYMSEVSGESTSWLAGSGGTVGQGAITIAKRIHDAFVHGGMNGYVYWNFADANSTPDAESLLGNTQFSNPGQSKKYNAFKHFSRYVRPGMQRVNATFAGTSNSSFGGSGPLDTYASLNVSAFASSDSLTVVLVNMRSVAETVNLTVPSSPSVSSFEVYRTNGTDNFARQTDAAVSGGVASVSVPAYSVVTLRGVAGSTPPPPPPPPPPSGDTTAPTAPTSLTSTSVTGTTAGLSWNASTDNVGVTGYNVFNGTALAGSTTSTTYTVTGLARNRTYTFTVKAKDAAGNVSAASNAVTVKTLRK